ncbi:putative glutamyl-tRNA(Gln) amidotransferase subunit C [groundwater metagenome]|uniref:Putative glutamyl-tRNA(Gln) amidotransferase subunit C n=1 Tax=groundwater metagenome TaxID=717931 RepID=A0A098E7T6_9ZZZZ
MDENKIKQIEDEGKKLIEDFSKSLERIEEKIKDDNMTWYVSDINTVTRKDEEGVEKNFKECLNRNAPKWEDGYVKVD